MSQENLICFAHIKALSMSLPSPIPLKENGVAERKNRTLVDKARSVLSSSKLPNNFWAEVVATTVYLFNISPTHAVFNKTTHEA